MPWKPRIWNPPRFGSSIASVPGSTAPVQIRRCDRSNSISCQRSHLSENGQAALYVGGGVDPGIKRTTLTVSPSCDTFTLEDDIKEKRGFHPEESATEFRLAMSDISEMTLLPTLLADLKKVAPRCTVRTMSMGPEQMAVGLESGQIDLAIGYIPELKGGGIFQQQLLVHSFTCLLRIDHPIRSLKLSKSQYEALEHIVVETPIRSQELVDRSIDAKKIKRNIVVRTPHFMSVPFLIAKSDMCATVPAAVGEAHKSTGMLRIVQPPFTPPTFPVRQHWHRRYANDPRSRWLRAFVFHSLHQ